MTVFVTVTSTCRPRARGRVGRPNKTSALIARYLISPYSRVAESKVY